jgi:glucose/arabinose dehydrogenase/regulation of enolase protein 1 (concanavalin A-like superfamily)
MTKLPPHAVRGVTGLALSLIAACTSKSPAPTELVATPASVPTDFVDEIVASGLDSPTAMQFAPDGRIFVCQQGGALRVIKNGTLLSTPFLTVTTDPGGERGLLGVAFDPNFASNQFVYVYYTALSPTTHNRVSRFTANGDVAVPGSEMVLIDLDTVTAGNHNGGAIHFGKDGKLYIGTGDNANFQASQSMNTVLGKLLRINPDGTIPTDNPFFNTATGKNRAIWALGLRNVFTFAVQPGTGRIFMNDVGEFEWEEVNEGFAGANYGWSTTEGPTSDARFRTPIHAYHHNTGACAITGGTFYNPTSPAYPASYVGKYFYNESCGGQIRMLDTTTFAMTPFASGAHWPVDVKTGTDGHIHYLARDDRAVRRIRYVGSAGQAPVIQQHPASITRGAGQSATFTVSASGTQPLSYQWQRNGGDIGGATGASYTIASVSAADNGATFRVRVTNGFGTATSDSATLTVPSNQAPTGTITTPGAGALYSAGETINYTGTATDPEQGTLPASAYSWSVIFHHDEHTHPFLDNINGVTGGSFVIPTEGERSTNVWYRIHLTVRDSGGLVHTTFRDIRPRVVNLTLQTNPPGLQLELDGMPFTSPATVGSVVGMVRGIGAPTPQTAGGNTLEYASWSDGGARVHTVATPAANTTYTATYQAAPPPPPPPPASWVSQDIGPVGATGSWTFMNGVHAISGAGADIWGTADSFRFTHQQVTGDFVITARVTALQRTHDYAKAGVMARASLATNSVNLHSLVSPVSTSRFRFIKRVTTGGTSTVEPGPTSPLPGAPGWVRLQRTGNVFRAFTSTDGDTFAQMGTNQTVSMPSTIYVGLAVTSHVAGKVTNASFDSVSISGGVAPPPPPPAPPAAPAGLMATSGDGQVSLTWGASSTATSYTVKRSTTSGSGYTSVQANLTSTSFTNTGLMNGTTYYYVVTASNAGGESGISNQASATPVGPPPPPPPSRPDAPTALMATAGNGQVSLTWSPSSGATSYSVKRSTTSGSGYALVQGNLTGTSYTNGGLMNGTTYYYVVSASNAGGESDNSSQASATPVGAPVTWSSQDVGAVGAAGSWSEMTGTYTVRGAGADIWGTADGFRFVYRPITANATITARVVSIENKNGWSKAGIMIRNGLTAGAQNVMMLVSPTDGNGYRWQVRSTAASTTTSTRGGAGTRPVWLRIVRNGNTLTGSYSANGTTWTQLGTKTISMSSPVQVGLAVTSHVSGTLATGVFDNVTITTP